MLLPYRYSSTFSYHLARCIHALLRLEESDNSESSLDKQTSDMKIETTKSDKKTKAKRIAFISCPTAYVGYRYLYPETSSKSASEDNKIADHRTDEDSVGSPDEFEPYLFEYDERFSLLTPPQSALPSPGFERFVHYDLNKPLEIPSSLESTFDMVILDPPYLNKDTNWKMAQTAKKLLSSQKDGKILLITGQSISEAACEIYGNEQTGPLRRAEKVEIEHVGLANVFGAWGNWDGIEDFGATI